MRINSKSPIRRTSLVAALLTFQLGCAETIGEDFITGLTKQADSLGANLARGAGAGFAESVDDTLSPSLSRLVAAMVDSLDPGLDAFFSGLFDSIAKRVDSIQRTVPGYVRGDINNALRELLSDNLDVVRNRVDDAVARWISTAAETAGSQLPTVAGNTAGQAVKQAMDTLSASLDSTGTVRVNLVNLADAVVAQAIETIAREQPKIRIPAWLWAIAAAFVLIALATVGILIVMVKRRQDSLRLVSKAIQDRGTAEVTEHTKDLAQQYGVEPWFHDFLEKNHLKFKEAA